MLLLALFPAYDYASAGEANRTITTKHDFQLVWGSEKALGKEWDSASLQNGHHILAKGSPMVPAISVQLKFEAPVDKINVKYPGFEEFLNIELAPCPSPISLGLNQTRDEREYNKDLYEKDTWVPEEEYKLTYLGKDLSEGEFWCYSLELRPFRYNPGKRTARFSTSADVDITLEEVQRTNRAPEDTIKYIVIGNTSAETAFDQFIEWKTEKGTPAAYYTLDHINSTFTGSDLPERIKNFTAWAHAELGTDYFLLAGDHDVVPPRYVKDPTGSGSMPSDIYYMCLDGTWDVDGDKIFGEIGDLDDTIPDVQVGRLTVQIIPELQQKCQEIIAYQCGNDTGPWCGNSTMIGAQLTSDYPDDAYVKMEYLRTENLQGIFSSFDGLYTYTGNLDTAAISSSINDGTSLICLLSHGDSYRWWEYTGSFTKIYGKNDANILTNNGKKPVIFAVACSTNQYDRSDKKNCLGEEFTNLPGMGAIAYIGSPRTASAWDVTPTYGPCTDGLQMDYCQALEDGEYVIGNTFTDMLSTYATNWAFLFNNDSDNGKLCTKEWMQITLLGDPEVDMWTSEPTEMDIQCPEYFLDQGGDVPIRVTSGGAPVEGAKVCMQGQGIYLTTETDAKGWGNLSLGEDQKGTVTISVTAHDHLPNTQTVMELARLWNQNKDLYYDDLQIAVDNADDGDVIQASSGMLLGDAVFTKNLTIIGAGAGVTKILGQGNGPVLLVQGVSCRFEGFSIIAEDGIGIKATPSVDLEGVSVYGCTCGVRVDGSTTSRISNCSIFGNTEAGIYLKNCQNTIITNNSVYANSKGLVIEGGSSNQLEGNTLMLNEGNGILLQGSTGNILGNNSLIKNAVNLKVSGDGTQMDQDIPETNLVNGRIVYYSYGEADSTIQNMVYGHVTLANAGNISLDNITVYYGDGVSIHGSNDVNFADSSFVECPTGLAISDSNCSLSSCDFHNVDTGISMQEGSVNIQGGTLTSFGTGINIGGGSFEIAGASFDMGSTAVSLGSDAVPCIISQCTFANTSTGISISNQGNALYSNDLTGTGIPFTINDNLYQQIIPENNTINGDQIIYLANADETVISGQTMGMLYMANCRDVIIDDCMINDGKGISAYDCTGIELDNVTIDGYAGIALSRCLDANVSRCNIYNASTGLELGSYSAMARVVNCTIACCVVGIGLGGYTSMVEVIGNAIHHCDVGIAMSSTTKDIAMYNSIHTNGIGVRFIDAPSNDFQNNTLTGNGIAMCLQSSLGNTINYNNFGGSSSFAIHALDNAPGSVDARWNYWGNFTGPAHAGNPGGCGENVTDLVDYSNWLGAPVSYSLGLSRLPGDIIVGEYRPYIQLIELDLMAGSCCDVELTGPEWLELRNGRITGRPLHWDVGEHLIRVQVEDCFGGERSMDIKLTVEPAKELFEVKANWEGDCRVIIQGPEGSITLSKHSLADSMVNAYAQRTEDGAVVYIYEPGEIENYCTVITANQESTAELRFIHAEAIMETGIRHLDTGQRERYVASHESGTITCWSDADNDGEYESQVLLNWHGAEEDMADSGIWAWIGSGLLLFAVLAFLFWKGLNSKGRFRRRD